MNTTSYLLLRLAIGTSMFGHGLVRLPKLPMFSTWMVGAFKDSMLPEALVKPFSYGLPCLEFSVGLLLLLGLKTRFCLIAGSVAMIFLIFGTCLIEHWDALPSQFIHVAFFATLLHYSQHNTWCLDRKLK